MSMERNKTRSRKKIVVLSSFMLICLLGLIARLVFLMVFRSDYYTKLAVEVQQRERKIKAARGRILDRNGVVLASNRSVCTISVIHNQIRDPQKVIRALSAELDIPEEKVRRRVEKVSSIERIKSNVDKETGDRILAMGLSGVKVDEDYKRDYPYGDLASKVLGFTGGDNQGIIGLEAVYDRLLKGTEGRILEVTDSAGRAVEGAREHRREPVSGSDLNISLDYNIQEYCTQAAKKAYIQKEADGVSIMALNPKNGEIYAMVDYPEFDLNTPFELTGKERIWKGSSKESQACNRMWRNWCVSDTYEPGSVFKIITASAALQEKVVKVNDHFSCPGYIMVEDRKIRCHKTTGHGAETFEQGLWNSCNPVFITVGTRLGAKRFTEYFQKFGLMEKTGIDLPGEASTIMHRLKDIGPVELATISFGQSFQTTPIQMASTVSSLINGGTRITPHFALGLSNEKKETVKSFSFKNGKQILDREVSETMRKLLEGVVSKGGGKKAAIKGYEIGGKTATSQTLPRSSHKYISSFLGFYPAADPKLLVMIIIRNPSGVYYGGTIAAPVAKEIFANIIPYLDAK